MNKIIKLYKYPDPDKIEINKASLELKLRDYKKNAKNKISWSDFLFLIPAWAILFTSKFDGFWIFSGELLKGAYLTFMIFGTLILMAKLKNKIPFFKKYLAQKNYISKVIENIIEECEQ